MIAGSAHDRVVVFHIAVLVADAVDGAYKHSVRDGMRTLDSLPRIVLTLPKLLLFARMPADGRREEKRFSAFECRDASAFRIPLIPAYKGSNRTSGRVLCQEAKISRREVKLLIVERVVGDVHLAIDRGNIVWGR